MLLKLLLIICLLLTVSFAVNIKPTDNPAQFTNQPVISGESGSGSGSYSSGGSGCPTAISSGSGSGSGRGATTVNDGVTYKASNVGLEKNVGFCGEGATTGDTGTGSGRSATTVNDGVTYKASNLNSRTSSSSSLN